MASEQWRAVDEWQHMRWLVVDESDNRVADCFGPDAKQHAEQIVREHNRVLAATDRDVAREVERLRAALEHAAHVLYRIGNERRTDDAHKINAHVEHVRISQILSSSSAAPEGDGE